MSLAPKISPIPPKSTHRVEIELERWVCERLHLRDLFAGVTDKPMRAARLKVVLLERGLTESIAGKRDGKPITWRALFEQLYGEQLCEQHRERASAPA